jgi:hypothetical protein
MMAISGVSENASSRPEASQSAIESPSTRIRVLIGGASALRGAAAGAREKSGGRSLSA